jgi:DNA sulfur modification protein DndD
VPGDKIEAHINQFIPEEVARFYLFDAELLQEYETLLVEDHAQGQKIKEAIETILGIPALIRGRDELRDLLKKAQVIQAKESKHVQALESQSNQSLKLQDEIEAHERDLTALKAQAEEISEQLEAIDGELARSKPVQELHRRTEACKEQQRGLREQERDLRKERLDVVRQAWKDLLQPRLQARRREIAARLSAFEQKIKDRGGVEERIRSIRSVLDNSTCPTCGAQISSERREYFGSALGELTTQLLEYETSLSIVGALTQELGALNRLASSGAGAALRRIDKQLSQQSIQIVQIESEMENLLEQLRGHDIARIAQIAKEKDGYLKVRGRVEANIESLSATIDEKRGKVRQLSVLMTRNPEGRKQRSSREVEIYSGLEKVFADSIGVFRDEVREKVAAAATVAFRQLTTESTYTGLKINKNYGLAILDRQGQEVGVRSAGAEQIVALSLLSALNKTANRPGPVVIDTPFGRLDPRHRVNIMRFVPEMAEQLVFLVHEGEIDRSTGLDPIRAYIGVMYEIQRVTSSHSTLNRL